ncbi:hypothetical protein M3Y99_01230800 [Aphelenchoides fujianensis]|nr:hypothetical protein M3Y99_01230800 [Aphelenchoides fujianensis]
MDEWDEDTYVEAERLPHTRLVCSSRHCTETRPGIDGRGKIVYKSTCLEPYVFPDGVRQYFGNPAFETAACMNKRGKCRKCKCPFKMHMAVEHQMVVKKREPKAEEPADSKEEAEDPTTSTKTIEEPKEEALMPKKSLDIPVALLPPIPQPEESELAERSLIYAAAVRRGSKPKLPRFSDVLEVIPPAESSKNFEREEKTVVDAKEDDVESVYSNVQPSKPPAAARPKKAADQEFEQLACLIDSLMDQSNEKCRRWLLNNPVVVPKEEEADRPFGRVARLLAGVVLRIKRQFGQTHGHRLK